MIKRCPKHGYFRGESCECGDPGKIVLDEERSEKLGRLVAGALRHFPDDLGLKMDPNGWVDLDGLADVIKTRYLWSNRKLLIALIQSDPKMRYEIDEGRVRARYGHSVNVDLDYPVNELPYLYYGASEEEADRLLDVGLKSATQRYVHLSTTPEKAWHVSTFRTNNPRVIKVDAEAAQEEGVKVMTVSENIVISENIPPQHLSLLPSREILASQNRDN